MKLLLNLVTLIVLNGCNDSSINTKKIELPTSKEVSKVILAVMEQDSNYNFKAGFTSIEMPRTIVHFRTTLISSNKVKPVVFPTYGVNVNSLIGYGITTEKQLKISDSLFFLQQNINSEKTLLDQSEFQGFRILTIDSIKKHYSEEHFSYLQFGTPVFATNKSFAFLQSNIICRGLCGEGRVYILEKKHNVWILRESIRTWVG